MTQSNKNWGSADYHDSRRRIFTIFFPLFLLYFLSSPSSLSSAFTSFADCTSSPRFSPLLLAVPPPPHLPARSAGLSGLHLTSCPTDRCLSPKALRCLLSSVCSLSFFHHHPILFVFPSLPAQLLHTFNIYGIYISQFTFLCHVLHVSVLFLPDLLVCSFACNLS